MKTLDDINNELIKELGKRDARIQIQNDRIFILRQLLVRAEMYVLPTEQTNGLISEIREALKDISKNGVRLLLA